MGGGQLWSADWNAHCQLGIGNKTYKFSSVQVDLKDKKVVSVAIGNQYSLVVLEGGKFWSAGLNGQLSCFSIEAFCGLHTVVVVTVLIDVNKADTTHSNASVVCYSFITYVLLTALDWCGENYTNSIHG